MIDIIVVNHEPENVPLGERIKPGTVARAVCQTGASVRSVTVLNAESGLTSTWRDAEAVDR